MHEISTKTPQCKHANIYYNALQSSSLIRQALQAYLESRV